MSPRRLNVSSLTLPLAGALLSFFLLGCSTPPAASVSNEKLPFDQAIALATDTLVQQAKSRAGLLGNLSRRTAVLDPTLDAASGQQTAATQGLDRALTERIVRDHAQQIEVLPFQASNLAKAQYLLTGTLTRAQEAYRLNLALVDLPSGAVVAQSSAMARPEGVDMRPLAFYRDSPVLMKDKVIDGYVRTSSTAPGQKADASYLARIAQATVINDATALYNAARYREALGEYRSAMAGSASDQVRVLNGIYLSNVKLGQTAEAEEAFGTLVAFGIANNSLGVKFLFNPGTTDFWSDPKVTSAYAMWLRQIARQVSNAAVCMNVVGHTSKTGPEAVNDALSLKRAVAIARRLGTEAPKLSARLRTEGMGSKQNIVGTGTDDVVDAPDRRVEFSMVDCAAG